MAEIFKNEEDVTRHVSVNNAIDLRSFAPDISMAAKKYIIPFIGNDFYSELDTQADAGTLTSDNQVAIEYLRSALINFALYEYVPLAQVQFSDAGIHISVSENKKTAFEHQVKALRLRFIEAGYENLEYLLAFLEENKSNYATWKNSSSYANDRKNFINTATDFLAIYPIKRASQTFRALLPAMNHAEEFAIKPVIGEAYFSLLKQKIKDGSTLSSSEKIALEYISKAVAHFTINVALQQSIVNLTDEGIMFYSESSINDSSNDRIGIKMRESEITANRYISKLMNVMKSDLNSYPLFKSYLEEESAPEPSVNDDVKGIFVV